MDSIKVPEKKPFVIDDDQKANWAFHKLAEAHKELEDVKDKKRMFDRQNQEWFESESKSFVEAIDYFEQLLEQYRQTKPNGKVKVPAGYTQMRHTKEFERDVNKLIPFVEKNFPDYVKKDIKWGDFKKQLTDYDGVAIDPNGQKVPGIRIRDKVSISYKPNKLGDELDGR